MRCAGQPGRIGSRNVAAAAVFCRWQSKPMTEPHTTPHIASTASGTGRRLLIVALLGLLLAAGTTAALLWPAPAGSQPPVVRVLGKTPNPPPPACPATARRNCMAVGNATVFQVRTDETVLPHRVPFHGAVVAWSITLSKPKRSEVRGFDDFYGGPSQARISVLRRVGKRRPPIFKLVRQSPVQELNRFFGRTAHFVLRRPLAVRRGQIVALSIPTWAPNWAINLSDRNSWRSSRHRTRCSDADIEEHSRPQQRIGSNRQYGCFFSNARFLYTATIVRDPDAE